MAALVLGWANYGKVVGLLGWWSCDTNVTIMNSGVASFFFSFLRRMANDNGSTMVQIQILACVEESRYHGDGGRRVG
jgi:hypothetical protein